MTTQKNFEIVIKTLHGLEPVLTKELENLGIKNIQQQSRAVSIQGDLRTVYLANYYLRTALKVLIPIHNFKVRNDVDLYNGVNSIEWDQYFERGDTLAIEPVINSENFPHSLFAAQKAKDAIVDQLRKKLGRRPSVDIEDPTYRVNLYISNDDCVISLDSSGHSLHKRGYRLDGNIAPLNECLAAGMLLLAEWDGSQDFLDLMCGSGTLPIEAALIAYNVAPGVFRQNFAFENWNNFDVDLFDEVSELIPERKFEHKIIARDLSTKTVSLARANIANAFLKDKIDLATGNMFDFEPKSENGLIILNPPYGERIKNLNIPQFYMRVGDKLKKDFSGFQAWVISSHMEGLKKVGLRTSKKIPLYNGKLECRFNKYDLYKGSKKTLKKQDN